MSNTVVVPIRMSKSLREKAKKDSKDMFGEVNVSGLIKHLLQTHKSKK